MSHFLMIGTTELVAIVVVVLLLFGGKKIPELMRGLGSGVKSFKDGMKEEFEAEFKKEFENDYILLSHKQVLEAKLFGDKRNHKRFEEFIGDYLGIAKSDMSLNYIEKPKKYMVGQHSGCLDDELLVPIIVYKKMS